MANYIACTLPSSAHVHNSAGEHISCAQLHAMCHMAKTRPQTKKRRAKSTPLSLSNSANSPRLCGRA